MTIGELIEILELLDSDMTVYVSKDGICGDPVRGVDYVRKIRNDGPAHEKIVDDAFVMIH